MFDRKVLFCFWIFALLSLQTAWAQIKPNIVLVMMDDVGYGDLSCHGNPVIQTPHIDRLYEQSIRLTNYHTGTTCSPTRASLLTGRHYDKLGVWHTIIGRSLLRSDVTTLPEVLVQNGYSTAIFGKWHLGDNYPMRPQDQGFQYTFTHGGGGVGQTPDYWGNDYFDDTYFRNGKPVKVEGYCTDVWVGDALDFIAKQRDKKKPFFCYIPLNAAHLPHRAPPRYIEPYKNNPDVVDPVYNGMVSNIDENVGRIMDKLNEWGMTENTIFIFTSDNGTSHKGGVLVDKSGFVVKGYNAGMRGVKGQPYEGGHREPFFISYPKLAAGENKDIDHLSSCLDVMPTLLALCGIKSSLPDTDGENLLPYLKGQPANTAKIYIADTQRGKYLKKYKQYCVMQGSWRLVGEELFDLRSDPGQRTNVAGEFPEVVARLKTAYETWWKEVEKENSKHPFVRIPVLPDTLTPLNCMDLFPDDKGNPAWNQEMVKKEQNVASGVWKLKVKEAGTYEVTIQQFPVEADEKLMPAFNVPGRAYLQVNDQKPVQQHPVTTKKVSFTIYLQEGNVDLRAGFTSKDGKAIAAQFAYIKRIESVTSGSGQDAGTRQPSNAAYPVFNWEKVPVIAHFGKSKGVLTDEQIRFLAEHFPLVALEKSHGFFKWGSTESGTLHDAARLKKINPGIKVIYYWNAFIDYGRMYEPSVSETFERHPEWTLRDLQGNVVLVHDNKYKRYDPSNKAFREWWTDLAAEMVSKKAIDGVFVDALPQLAMNRSANVKIWGEEKQNALEAGMMAGFRMLREKIGDDQLIIYNGLRGRKNLWEDMGARYYKFCDAAMLEHFITLKGKDKAVIANDIEAIQRAGRMGKIVIVKGWPEFDWLDNGFTEKYSYEELEKLSREQITFPLACFLAAAGENAFFCYTWGYTDTKGTFSWYPEFDKPLGAPKSEAVKNGWVYTREFEHASVWVDIERKQARIKWR